MKTYSCNHVPNCSDISICKNYVVGMFSLALMPVAGVLVPTKYLPFISLVSSLVLFSYVGKNRRSRRESCAIVPYIAARTLLGFTVFSLIINFVSFGFSDEIDSGLADELRRHSVFYLCVIHFSVTFLMAHRRWENTFCQDCLLRNGLPQEREKLGHIYIKESRYLLRRLMKVSGLLLLLTAIPIFVYENGDFSQTKAAIIYVFIPVAIWIVDSLYVRFRYSIVWKVQHNEIRQRLPYEGRFKLVRIIAFDDNGIYFLEKNGEKDTPFSFYEPYSQELSLCSAKAYMKQVLNECVCGDEIRFCYGTVDAENNRSIEHYLCYVENRSSLTTFEVQNGKNGIWQTKEELENGFNQGFSGIACSELHRIYTVMQMSKAYFPNGRRRVDIKGYCPSFTLAELRTADVDFGDNRWMLLSKFNKDIAFYALKKAWHQYIEGLK